MAFDQFPSSFATFQACDWLLVGLSTADKGKGFRCAANSSMAVIAERTNGMMTSDDWFRDWIVRLNRVMFM